MVPAFTLTGCSGPLSTLDPAGPGAAAIAWLWWVMLAGSACLTLLVMLLVMLSFGPPREQNPRRWTLGMGIWMPVVVLSALLGAGLWVGERLLPREAGVPEVRAHAFQWGWRFSHPGPQGPVETVDIVHLPAGQPVDMIITAEEVIHSFWIPRAAGKMDAIPGYENRLRLQIDAPGRLDGLCAEFCGLGHADMRFSVEVHPPEDWPQVLMSLSEENG